MTIDGGVPDLSPIVNTVAEKSTALPIVAYRPCMCLSVLRSVHVIIAWSID